MSCKIEFVDGKISKVFNKEGKESEVFKQIASIPHVQTLEQALDLYKNIYEEEAPLTFTSDKGNEFTSYAEALQDSTQGDIKILSGSNEIMSVSSNANPETFGGFLNYQIKNNVMSDQKLIENGQSYFLGKGVEQATELVNQYLIQEDAKLYLGSENVRIYRDGRIELQDKKGTIELNGEQINVLETPDSELLKQEDGDVLVVDKAISQNFLNNVFGQGSIEPLKPILTEQDLRFQLLNLLEKMGVKTTTISNYVSQYENRNNVEPSANALADIANQIIAFKDGQISTDTLTEETAHFIVEAWNEQDISDLLRNISRTEEYQQFANIYREAYKNQAQGEELENLVRKEVLGKILSKALQSNFQAQEATRQNIFDYIKNLFLNFINKVRDTFAPQYQQKLNEFTSQVQDLLLRQDIDNYLNLSQLKNKKFTLYQLGNSGDTRLDNIASQASLLLRTLQDQERDLKKAGKGFGANLREMKRLQGLIDDAQIKEAIAEMLQSAKRQTKYIAQAADQANKKGQFLSQEEDIVYHSLTNTMLPMLNKLNAYMKEQEYSELKEISSSIINDILEVQGQLEVQESAAINNLLDRIIERTGLGEEYREVFRKALEAAKNDTSAFYATFGQLAHASDPLLNATQAVISDMTRKANVGHLNSAKPFASKLEELGLTPKDLSQFFRDGYIIDYIDWSKFSAKMAEIEAEALKEVSPDSENASTLDQEQYRKYETLRNEKRSQFIEERFLPEYRQAELKKYKENFIDEETIRFRKELSTKRGIVNSRAMKDGKIRFSNQDKIDMQALNLQRRLAKRYIDDEGNNKEGITSRQGTLENKVQKDIIEVNGTILEIDREKASKDAILAFDLNKLDVIYQQELKEQPSRPNDLSQEFLQALKDTEDSEGREAALDFFELNTFTTFSEQYWNSLDSESGLVSRLEKAGFDDFAVALKVFIKQRQQLLRTYQSQTNAAEIAVEEMPNSIKQRILELTDEIDNNSLQAYRLLKDTRPEQEILLTENTPNQAYNNAIQDQRLDTFDKKIDFINKHTTPKNRALINDIVAAYYKGGVYSSAHEKLLGRFGESIDQNTILRFAESKLAPYYRRFAPQGFSELQNRLRNSEESVYDIVSEMNADENLQITNNYSYYKAEENPYTNPNYQTDFEGGYLQPKAEMFVNQKFVDLFAPTVRVVDGKREITATKNQKLFEAYKASLDYYRDSYEALGILGEVNLWQAPQISRTNTSKFVDFLTKGNKGQTLKELIKDAISYRVDDQDQGAQINGVPIRKSAGTRVIPRFFIQKLESQADVSDDLFFTLTAFGQQAQLYKARKNAYSDFAALENAMLNRQYPNGAEAASTNVVKMFRSAVDSNLYGIRESKQLKVSLPIVGDVDLTKLIRLLHKWVNFRALGFNPVVAFTSLTTGKMSILIEKIVGEYMNPHSNSVVRRFLIDKHKDVLSDIGEVNSKAELNKMLEYFNLSPVSDRYRNAKYSKIMRLAPKLGNSLNEMANYPVVPNVMAFVLADTRLVDGQFLDFVQFKNKRNKEGKSSQDTIKEWKTLEDRAILNYRNVTGDVMTYNYDDIQRDMGNDMSLEEVKKYVENLDTGLYTKMTETLKLVDGRLPDEEKTAAHRHYALSYLLTFRNWMLNAISKRLKNAHYNLQSHRQEEGTYRTAGRHLKEIIDAMKGGKWRSFLEDVKKQWAEADEYERQNIKRVMKELAVLQAVIALGLIIGFAADDDEKDGELIYSLQLTNYLYYRLMNETTSSQVGLFGEFYGIVESPIVGADTVKSIASITDYYNTDEVKSGRFAGMQKWQTHWMKIMPGYKASQDLANPRDAYSTYSYFNSAPTDYSPVSWIVNTTQDEE